MRMWVTRLIAMMFMVSLVMAPQSSVLAVENLPGTAVPVAGDSIEAGADDNASSDADAGDDDVNAPEGDDSAQPGNIGDGETSEGPGSTEDEGDGAASDGFDGSGEGERDSSENDAELQPGDQSETETDRDEESVPGYDANADEESGDATSTPGPVSSSSVAPLSFQAKFVPLPSYDMATGTLTINFTLNTGFSAAAGDEFYIEYEPWLLNIDASSMSATLPGIDGLSVEVLPQDGEIVVTFQSEVTPLESAVSGSVSMAASVNFESCYPSTEPYPRTEWLYFYTPSASGSIEVEGPECPANADPAIVHVDYDEETGLLEVGMVSLIAPAPGQQVTLTYEQNELAMEPGPFSVGAVSWQTGEVFIVGSATASNGVITIEFVDANMSADLESEFVAQVELIGWLQGGTCADTNDPVHLPGGELEFVANNGSTFYSSYPPFVCNLAGPSIVGEWDTDEFGQPLIHWTIDTGDLVLFAGVDSYDLGYLDMFDVLSYDCDSLTISNVSGDFTVSDRYCSNGSFYYDLEPQSTEPYRATINVTTALDLDLANMPLSVVNCVEVWMQDDLPEPDMLVPLASQPSNGLGGEACYEMFLDLDGGDVLTKTVDKAEVLPGETLTYTVQVSTTTNLWNVIDLSDTIPAGFVIDPDSVTCTVEPSMYQLDPCYVLSDTTARVQVRAVGEEEQAPWERIGAPLTITLSYAGQITAEPGTTLTPEACSVRTFVDPSDGEGGPEGPAALQATGDQSVVGGGRMCTTASTLVLQPDIDPTETPTAEPTETPTSVPSETPTQEPGETSTPETTAPATPGSTPTPESTTPATPGASPTAPVDTDADPTATSAVTGLPETGNSGPSATSTLFIASIAAGIMIVAGIGIQVRLRE